MTDPEVLSLSVDDLKAVKDAVDVPVLVGSGVTPETAPQLLAHADALIVGSGFKKDGLWSNPPDAERVRQLVKAILTSS